MRITYSENGRPIAAGHVDALPGSTQVCVFHSSFVLPEERGKGIGWKAHEQRLQYAKDNLYDYAICTVADSNDAQNNILSFYKWKKVGQFFSKKTNHWVNIYALEL